MNQFHMKIRNFLGKFFVFTYYNKYGMQRHADHIWCIFSLARTDKNGIRISEYQNSRLEGIHFQPEIHRVWTLATGSWSSLSLFQVGNAFYA